MNREGKVQLKNEIAEKLGKANAVILAEYRGLSVGELTDLRVELRKSDAEFKVNKNRIFKRALEEDRKEFESLKDELVGPVGTVFVYGDTAQATKSLLEFNKGHENLKVKCGFMDGQSVDESALKAIADLPSREVLLGQIVGSLASPSRGLVTTLSGVARNLVYVINAIKEKKAQEG